MKKFQIPDDIPSMKCPWCKKKVELWDEEDAYYPGGPVVIGNYIECRKCDVKMHDKDKNKLIKRWNSLYKKVQNNIMEKCSIVVFDYVDAIHGSRGSKRIR